jgi:hypothetical protein
MDSPFAGANQDATRRAAPIALQRAPISAFAPATTLDKVYLLEVSADARSLQSAAAAMTAGESRVEFVELPEALPQRPAVLTAEAVLWWTRPPAAWSPWTGVPVVVEAK